MHCGGCEVSREEFLALVSDPAQACRWLQRHGVLRDRARCKSCGETVPLEVAKLRFRCRRRVNGERCNFARSVRVGTWCGVSTASFSQICRFCATWLLDGGRRARLMAETPFASEAAVRWMRYCRDVLVGWAVRRPRKVGGPGRVVELEAAVVRKNSRSRYCHSRAVWAVGGVEPGAGRAFLLLLPSCEGDALAEALRPFVRHGSALASGLWEAYGSLQLSRLPGVTFRQRAADAERTWLEVMCSVPDYQRPCRRLYVGHLADFLFRRAHPPGKRLHRFFSQVRRLFPPPP